MQSLMPYKDTVFFHQKYEWICCIGYSDPSSEVSFYMYDKINQLRKEFETKV